MLVPLQKRYPHIDCQGFATSFLVQQRERIREGSLLAKACINLIQKYALELLVVHSGKAFFLTVAQSDGKGVGFVAWHQESDKQIYIQNIVTDPYENFGVGAFLLRNIIDWAKEHGCGKISLDAVQVAQTWWFKQGFRCCDVDEDNQKADTVLQKALAKFKGKKKPKPKLAAVLSMHLLLGINDTEEKKSSTSQK